MTLKNYASGFLDFVDGSVFITAFLCRAIILIDKP